MEELLNLAELEFDHFQEKVIPCFKRKKFIYHLPQVKSSPASDINVVDKELSDSSFTTLPKEKRKESIVNKTIFRTKYQNHSFVKPKKKPKMMMKEVSPRLKESKSNSDENSDMIYGYNPFGEVQIPTPSIRTIKYQYRKSFTRFKKKRGLVVNKNIQCKKLPTSTPPANTDYEHVDVDKKNNFSEIQQIVLTKKFKQDYKKNLKVKKKKQKKEKTISSIMIELVDPSTNTKSKFPVFEENTVFVWDMDKKIPPFYDDIAHDDDAPTQFVQAEWGKQIVNYEIAKAFETLSLSF